MPLSRRLPKIGFKNPMKRVVEAVNIDQLKRFAQGSVVDREALFSVGLVTRKADAVKILGKGEIGFPLSVKVDMISRGARQKIEAAGGTILEVI
jgi:large subunit ribosomal protein L15